jgi:hypothetical protein
MSRYLFILILLLVGCREDSTQALREAGRAKTRSLIVELKKIRSKDQLVAEEAKLKECFSEFLALVEEADALDEHVALPLEPVDHDLSDALRVELLRIVRIDGGKDVLLQVLISK